MFSGFHVTSCAERKGGVKIRRRCKVWMMVVLVVVQRVELAQGSELCIKAPNHLLFSAR